MSLDNFNAEELIRLREEVFKLTSMVEAGWIKMHLFEKYAVKTIGKEMFDEILHEAQEEHRSIIDPKE